jgi:hypothetical protein
MGDAQMNVKNGRKWRKIAFMPTMISHIKTHVEAEVIYKTELWLHEIIEVSTKHYILSPVTTRVYRILHLPMAYHFASANGISFSLN